LVGKVRQTMTGQGRIFFRDRVIDTLPDGPGYFS
jgi:hypothetical protein